MVSACGPPWCRSPLGVGGSLGVGGPLVLGRGDDDASDGLLAPGNRGKTDHGGGCGSRVGRFPTMCSAFSHRATCELPTD